MILKISVTHRIAIHGGRRNGRRKKPVNSETNVWQFIIMHKYNTTVGVNRKITRFNLGDGEGTLHFQLLDAAGSYKIEVILKSYMSSIDAIVFMYDISKKETFACLPLWTNLLNGVNTKRNLTKVLVGNKLDLPREVKTKNAVNYADFEGMIPMETSVKNGESVDLVFKRIVAELKMQNGKQFPTI